MSLLPSIVRAAFKKGNTATLNKAFQHRKSFVLPSTEAIRTYSLSSYANKLKSFNSLHQWDADELHPCFVQVLGLGLQMDILLQDDSPFPLIGLVHLGNQITIDRELEHEELTLTCRFGEISFHRKGILFSVDICAMQSNHVCLLAKSEYLYRVKSKMPESKSLIDDSQKYSAMNKEVSLLTQPEVNKAPVRLPGNAGRRYAQLSGDYNPIHLWNWSAKLLGFPAAIAHGMHTLAMSVSMMYAKTPSSFKGCVISNQFLNPALLPCELELHTQFDENNTTREFNLVNHSAPEHKQHLLSGTIKLTGKS